MKHANFIILYAVLLHLFWGISMLADPSANMISGVAGVKSLIGAAAAPYVFIAAALLGLQATIGEPRIWKAYIGVPQQFLLVLSSVGAIGCMIKGAFADNVIRPHAFLIADQSPVLIVAALHIAALLSIVHHSRLPLPVIKKRPVL